MQRTSFVRSVAFIILAIASAAGWSQKDSVNSSSTPTSTLPVIKFQSPEGSAPQDWSLRPRPPIQFTPFEMLDPNTGKPVNADDLIEVNGIKMTAGEFYRQLNAMEQWLNEHGYSLRTDTQFEYYSPTLEAELARSEEYIKWLEANTPLDGDIHGQSGDFTVAGCNNYASAWYSNWIGNSLFAIQVGVDIGAQACYSPLSANVSGSAVLRGALAGYPMDVARARGSATLNDSQWAYQVAVQVLGWQVWNSSNTGVIGVQRTWNTPIAQVNWGTPVIPVFCFPVFGIPVCAYGQLGITGQLNLSASVNITPSYQQASAVPYGELNGYAAAWLGLNLGFIQIEVGAMGVINFLRGGLFTDVSGQLVNSGSPSYQFNASFGASLSALSGNILGYARGCIWFFGWHCGQAFFPLFSWSGWHYNGTIVNWNRTFSL